MALEDVINSLERYGKIRGIDETLAKDATNPGAFNSFGNYEVEYEGLDPAVAQAQIRNLRRDPVLLRELTGTAKKGAQEGLVAKVAENYEGIVEAIDPETLQNFALNLPTKDKKYLELERAVQNGDVKKAKKVYADAFESDIWKKYIKNMQDEDAKTMLESVSAKYRTDFIKANFADEVEKDGKKEYVLNPDKLKKYVLKTLKAYEGGLKSLTHVELAGLYANSLSDD